MAEGYTCNLTNFDGVRTENQIGKLSEMARTSQETPTNESRNVSFDNTGQPCRFYSRGMCRFGDRCRNLHSGIYIDLGDIKIKATGIKEKSSPQPTSSTTLSADDWVNAPEFIPTTSKHKSYAEIVDPNKESEMATTLCPYVEANGACENPMECLYAHCELCDLCGLLALHPFDENERKKHTQECIQQHERDMELSFAIARSKEKTCGVCFEVVLDKNSREQRFGILPNCNHCFCLACIRKWRQARQFENKIIRACPECRVTSDFVCPSEYWVETKEEKDKLITDYKEALSQKDCKYFKKGSGKCPFGNKCFYLHAMSDGTKKDVGPPPRPHRRHNDLGELDIFQPFHVWDFIFERDNWYNFGLDDDDDNDDGFEIFLSDTDSENSETFF